MKKRQKQIEPGLSLPLDQIEPEQTNEHLKMLQQMLQEGTFQNLISKEKDLLTNLTLNNEFPDEDYLIDEEPIVIKMLDTMLARKKTVQERLELNMMLPTAE
jgi:hypothetical protein